MAIAVSALTSGSDSVDRSTYTTASVSPGADAGLLLFVIPGRTDGTAATSATITGLGLTWTLVDADAISTGNIAGMVYRAVTGGSAPAAGTISIAFGGTQHNAAWHLLECIGVDTAAFVVQSDSANFGNVAPWSITLASGIGSGNATLGFMAFNTNSFALTAGSGYTLVGTEQGINGPTFRAAAEYRLAGSTTVEADAAGGTAPRFIIGVEVKAASAAASLTAADSAHAHTSESPALTQAHSLTPADSAHGNTSDAATLTQAHVLAPADSVHAHASESPALSATDTLSLAPADSNHGHTSGSPSLTQGQELQPADSRHAHSSDTAVLINPDAVPPPERSYAVPAESRTAAVEPEVRIYQVPPDDRTLIAQ